MPSPHTHEVPAVTAGTPHVRNLGDDYPQSPHPYIEAFQVYNRYTAPITIKINGRHRVRVAAGDSAIREQENEVIHWYTVDVDSGTSDAADIDVYEYGGVHGAGPVQDVVD